MTSTNGLLRGFLRALSVGLVLAVLVSALMMASVAPARVDPYGGPSFSIEYAPYTETEPYAPYTAGPVVKELRPELYAPYTAGPVVSEDSPYAPYTEAEGEPYAPYTAGPVVKEIRPYSPYPLPR